jgi:prepilin-type N-terminal cleavage/methylation domain-containing protein
MIRQGRCARRSRRRGFSLMEMLIASMLMALLGVLLAQACVAFGRPALEVEARARITQESILAAQSLACDLGGFLSDPPGRTLSLSQYQFVDWDLSQGNVLLLNFQGQGPTDLVIISYQLQGNHLVRSNSSTGVAMTISNYVTGFTVAPVNTNQAKITITVAFRYFMATYTLIGVPPS